jgi:uncharacterized membrane protein YbhN (UPF0104 family)
MGLPSVSKRTGWQKWIGPAMFVAIMIFLVLYLKSINFHKLSALRIDWRWLLLASGTGLIYRYWAVSVWRVILRALGTQKLPPYRAMAQVFAKAWMARYIPGTVTWVVGRIYLASKYGISVSRLTVSSLLEGGMQVVAGIVISLLLIGLGGHVSAIAMPVKVLAVLVSVAGVITLLPPIFNRLLALAYRLLKKGPAHEELRINGKAVWQSFVLFGLASLVTGTANFFLAKSVAPQLGWHLYPYLVGTFGLAGALGIAVPFLPSGIGVRDGVQLVLLSLVVPKEMALAITILSRLWGLIIDVIFFVIAAGWHWRAEAITSER